MRDHFLTFARYNTWANDRLYDAVSTLEADDIARDRGGFFGSILGTLNHILVADRIWLGRIEAVDPGVSALDQILHDDFTALRRARVAFDAHITEVVRQMSLDGDLHYATFAGVPQVTPRVQVLSHLFNHQTHHRGQVHHMLGTAGVAPPPLDLIYFLRA